MLLGRCAADRGATIWACDGFSPWLWIGVPTFRIAEVWLSGLRQLTQNLPVERPWGFDAPLGHFLGAWDQALKFSAKLGCQLTWQPKHAANKIRRQAL